jgi:hypothetical protein
MYLREKGGRSSLHTLAVSTLRQQCAVCWDPHVDLHHKTYRRLGEELLDDLVPLCRDHHDELHERGLDFYKGPTLLYEEWWGRKASHRQKYAQRRAALA